MARSRLPRTAAATALLTAVAACAQPGAAAPATPTTVPSDLDAVVLRMQLVGGEDSDRFVAALPHLAVFADGRVFTPAPVPTIAPGPALPGWNVQRIDPSAVQALVDQALAAGIAEQGEEESRDAGRMRLRITLTTAAGTHVRELNAADGPPVALARLGEDLLGGGQPWNPTAVAAVVEPWADLPDLPPQPDVAWVGPPLPGEPADDGSGCVVTTGDQAQAVLDAARSATAATPWVTPDGARWAVWFRPLLPSEDDCADLLPE